MLVCPMFFFFSFCYYRCFCPSSGRHGQRVLESTCGLRRLTYIGDFHIEAPPRYFGLKVWWVFRILLFASARIFPGQENIAWHVFIASCKGVMAHDVCSHFCWARKYCLLCYHSFVLGCSGKWCWTVLAFTLGKNTFYDMRSLFFVGFWQMVFASACIDAGQGKIESHILVVVCQGFSASDVR